MSSELCPPNYATQFAERLLSLYPKREVRRVVAQSAQRGTLTEYQYDPVGYARDVLGAALTPDQETILRSLVDNRYTAVMASHGIGKTFVAAIAANWWYDCWPQHIVYLTAPTWPQALGLTFKEIKRARRGRRLPGRILESGRVKDEDPELEPGHFIRALNAENGEGFQGEHTAPILIILEEAVGVPRYIWEAAAGLMTHPECRLLAIANPTDEASEFGEIAGSPLYNTIAISALAHENIRAELGGQPAPYPRAVRLQWLYEMLQTECEIAPALEEDCFEFAALSQIARALSGQAADLSETQFFKPNAMFQGRVLGIFPTQANEQVVPKAWLDHLPEAPLMGELEIGCDVARYGSDRTVIVGRLGSVALEIRELRQLNNPAVAWAIREMADNLGLAHRVAPQRIALKIDVTGGLGTGPFDLLQGWGYRAVGVNSSEGALDEEHYVNRRSELWFSTRERARAKRLDLSRLPAETRQRLIKELGAPRWRPDERGRRVVEPKQDMKKRLGHSPDIADAFNLAFAGFAEVTHGRYPF